MKMEQLVKDAVRTDLTPDQYLIAAKRIVDNPRTLRLLHVAMGLCTEAGEFMDMLKKHVFYGKPLDLTNAIEELGDSSWYLRIGCDGLEIQFLEMLERNVRKLKARYPEKFTEKCATVRDLETERRILESK